MYELNVMDKSINVWNFNSLQKYKTEVCLLENKTLLINHVQQHKKLVLFEAWLQSKMGFISINV